MESYRLNLCATSQSLEKDMIEYMVFYNYKRFQETRNSPTPMEFQYQALA
ncbi:IS3 family transposase [Natronobacillus azotifigens]